MKIAIHHREGSFSEQWVEYCKKENIDYKIINAFENDIIEQVIGCNIFIWHHHHGQFKDVLTAKRVLFALEHAGMKVFPDFNTGWHFDDKVGQKYLLEAIGAPLVPSYVFYEEKRALYWVNTTSFPKVFKLKGGAGAANVSLVSNKREAIKKINKAFGKGFSQFNKFAHFREYWQKYKEDKVDFNQFIKAAGRLFISTTFAKMKGREKGYIYFQDFIPNNNSDIRVIVIGDKAFAIMRMVRTDDFRASGSEEIVYLNDEEIDRKILKIAFKTSSELNAQCLAFDFVYDESIKPLIVEISYGFAVTAYKFCPGYWSSDLQWHKGKFNPQEWIIEDLITTVKKFIT